ncbi:unnamed protein product [Calicophoron daubneyi]|uniref:GOLD domain-containing protein n=1 Tax=Calicophoron daubneyi TaxID=300641 RepID=A0AAV2T092_CALDB
MMLPAFFLLLSYYALRASGMYFHIKESETRCFLEDVPADTLVKGKYKLMTLKDKQYVPSTELSFHVNVYDPDDQVQLSRTYSSEGMFVFTAHKAGEHRICVSSDSNAWFGGSQLRIHLELSVADHAIDYGEVASRDMLNEFQLRVRQLCDQVQTIAKDQNYQRVREEYFRQLSESTSKRVTYWSIGQLILLGAIGFWQMRHLRAFFQAKKLV